MQDVIGSLFGILFFLASVGISIYVMVLAGRLVAAVERIANSMERRGDIAPTWDMAFSCACRPQAFAQVRSSR